MGVGRSFHQPGTVNENVLESDFEPLCDDTTRRRSLADLRLLFFFCHVLFVFCHESADNNLDAKGKKKPRKTTQAGGAGVDLAKITAEQQVKLHKERDERIAAVKTASAEKEAAGAVDSGGSASSPGDCFRAEEEVRRDGSGHTGLARSVTDTR